MTEGTTVIHTSPPAEDHAELLDSIHSRLDHLETRLQSIENGKADREHAHPELQAQLDGKAPIDHEHEGYATHDDLDALESDVDDLVLELDQDLDDAGGLEAAPVEGTTIGPGPEPVGEEHRHKPGMLI